MSSERLFRVYVDEAGTRFISPKSDDFFIVSAVLVRDSRQSEVRDHFRALKVKLGRLPEHALHFSQIKQRDKRLAAATGIAALPIAITNVVVRKDRLAEPGPAGEMAFISDPDPMYLWALRLLLERVSWLAKACSAEAIVTFSHVQGFQPAQIHEYRAALERGRDDPDMNIKWSVFDGHPFRVDGPANVELLQLADTTASSIYHAAQPGRDGRAYFDALKPKIYLGKPPRATPGEMRTYGVKIFP